MENRAKYILSITFTLLLISSASATLEEFTLDWEEDWEQFENTLDNCESANCITEDSLGNVEQEFTDVTIDTGDTGFCGTGGVKRDIVIPSGNNVGLALSVQKAQLDNWGGRVGVKADDEWLLTFSSEGGQSKTTDHTDDRLLGDESTYYADVSQYSGEEVTLKVATEDTSQEWCNMGDHEQSLHANALFIASDIQDTELTSSGEETWEKYQVNTVNCESQYNCDGDEKQPLDTNEISGGQLVLDTAIDESDGGHCGTYGREQWIYVPKADNVELNFEASAELDEWGGNLGVMFDDDWVFTFNDSGGEGRASYEMQERTRDVSDYSGEYVKLRVAYQDQSGDWCDMSDHDRRMVVESVGFETSGGESNQPPTASLNSKRFSGTTISFDATDSSDPDNGQGDLQTRWDWQNDGSWDSDWQNVLQRDYTYPDSTSQATAKVQVRDGDGGSDTATTTFSFGDNSGGNDGSDGDNPSGETQDIEIQDNGWKVIHLTEDVDRSKFSGCNGDEAATAYHADSETGYLQRADLSESGTLSSGKYFIQSTSTTTCTVESVEVSSSATTGEVEIPDNGWKTVNLGEETDRSKFSGCNGDEAATAYHADSETGYLQRADLSESGTLSSGKYFIQSTSTTTCTVDFGGSEDGDTDYASTEDEWCQTNDHGQALSSFRDDVESGCKPVNDLDYNRPSGGSDYYASENSGITCESGDMAYICED